MLLHCPEQDSKLQLRLQLITNLPLCHPRNASRTHNAVASLLYFLAGGL